VVKQLPWLLQTNNMAQTSIAASVSGASFVGETKQTSEGWTSLLSAASPQQQKMMLAEQLFPLVQRHQVIWQNELYKIMSFSTSGVFLILVRLTITWTMKINLLKYLSTV
jgi:hypothetical protein